MAVVVVVVGSLAVVAAVVTRFSPQGQYTVFGHPTMIVLSGSMAPLIRAGDLIVDDPVTSSQAQHLHAGQIITFRDSPTSKTVITHRIVSVIRSTTGAVAYVTKGDENNASDATPRPAAAVIGVYSAKVPRGGFILNALHQPLVLGLLLASPILWFLAEPLHQWARKLEEQEGQVPARVAGEAEAETP